MTTPIGPIPPVSPTAGASLPAPAAEDAAGGSGSGFAGAIGEALGKLDSTLADSTQQAQALAAGKADDVTAVVMATERASVALQLASQLRNKAVEAYQEIFRMQV